MNYSAQKQQGNLAMKTARYNQKVIKAQDDQDRLTSVDGMHRRRIENNRVLASVRNRMASGGVRSDVGSSSDYLRAAKARMETDILDQAQAQEYRSRARGHQSAATGYQGQVAQSNAQAMGNASLLKGGARIASMGHSAYQHSEPGEFMKNAFWF